MNHHLIKRYSCRRARTKLKLQQYIHVYTIISDLVTVCFFALCDVHCDHYESDSLPSWNKKNEKKLPQCQKNTVIDDKGVVMICLM